MTTDEILKIVKETFDEEISSDCTEDILGLSSWIEGKDEFFKKLSEKLKKLEK